MYPTVDVVRRACIREPAAEFLGTMVLMIFGCGANCQVILSSSTAVSSTPKGVSIQCTHVFSLIEAIFRPFFLLTLVGLLVRGKLLPIFIVLTRFEGLGFGVWVSGGISGGHLNPAVRSCHWYRYSCSNVIDDVLGYSCPGIYPWLPMEKSTRVLPCPTIGCPLWYRHYLWQLLPCDQRVRRRPWDPHFEYNRSFHNHCGATASRFWKACVDGNW